MKYNDNGTIKEFRTKAFDTVPIGGTIEYDGDVVPDGWEEVENPNLNIYSTKETQIGWWEKENGKKVPLYRKYITGNDTKTDQNINIPHNIENVDILMLSGESHLKINNEIQPLPRPSIVTTDMEKKVINYKLDSNNVILYVGSYVQTSGYSYCFILEYTKTTDKEV